MSKLNFDKHLFHPSAFHLLVTEPQTNAAKEAGELSKTAITELRTIYLETKYQRKREFESRYTEKGILQEDTGITLLSRYKKIAYKKNIITVTNDFLIGTPDCFKGDDIYNLQEGVDIKCPWSIFTFPYKDDKLTKNYYWQNQGYMFITGAKEWTTAFCLVNAHASLISAEKMQIWHKMLCPDQGDDNYGDYMDKAIECEKNMIFDMGEFKKENPGFDLDTPVWSFDIPLNERIVEFTVKRDEQAIEKIKEVVIRSRKYLNSLNNL